MAWPGLVLQNFLRGITSKNNFYGRIPLNFFSIRVGWDIDPEVIVELRTVLAATNITHYLVPLYAKFF